MSMSINDTVLKEQNAEWPFPVYSEDVVLRVKSRDELSHTIWRMQQQLVLTRVTVYHTEISSRRSVETVTIIEGNDHEAVNYNVN